VGTLESDAETVGSIVERCANAAFVRALMAAKASFVEPMFEPALADFLRTRPDLVDRWATYSGNQRWTPAAYVNGTEAGWYDAGRRDVALHPDEAAAVADFIHRTAAYLDANRVDLPTD
jgi:hypothetical protein